MGFCSIFQPTLPARGATEHGHKTADGQPISTHAPRTGSDRRSVGHCHGEHHFNPRSPHGERRTHRKSSPWFEEFQPTLPARGATQLRREGGGLCGISTHAPRTGSDEDYARLEAASKNFNPRSPHGERLRKVTILSIRIIDFAQKVYHKTVLLRISLAENAVILPKRPQNPVRTSLQKAGGLRFARAIRAAHPYSISSPSGA